MPYVILHPSSSDARVVTFEDSLTVGRAEGNDLVVADKSLSRSHARFDREDGVVVLRDLQSTRGTTVNGERVRERRLAPGDTVCCGDVALCFGDGASPPQAPAGEPEAPLNATVILPAGDGSASAQAVGSQEKLRTLLQVSEILSSPEGIDTLLPRTVDLLFEIMDVDRAALLVMEDGVLVPRVVRASRLPGAPAAAGSPAGATFYSRHIVDYVLRRDEAVLTSDAPSDARFDQAASILMQSIRSSMCVPFRARAKTLGVLYVDNVTVPDRFDTEDLEFLGAFANQAAIALENARLYRKIEDEALMRNSLLRFFPPGVIDRILQAGEAGLAPIETDVSTVFSDISGFTEMSSTRNPVEILNLLNEYFPVMADVVYQHEGTLEKYIGDALLAIWGAPFRREDDADRAVRAAVAMQRAMAELNARWAGSRWLQIHVGVNTGPVAAGRIGSERYLQYAAVGDTTNVASRICGLAAPGEILISRSTYDRLADKDLPLDPLEPRQVKGKAELLHVLRLDWQKL